MKTFTEEENNFDQLVLIDVFESEVKKYFKELSIKEKNDFLAVLFSGAKGFESKEKVILGYVRDIRLYKIKNRLGIEGYLSGDIDAIRHILKLIYE